MPTPVHFDPRTSGLRKGKNREVGSTDRLVARPTQHQTRRAIGRGRLDDHPRSLETDTLILSTSLFRSRRAAEVPHSNGEAPGDRLAGNTAGHLELLLD